MKNFVFLNIIRIFVMRRKCNRLQKSIINVLIFEIRRFLRSLFQLIIPLRSLCFLRRNGIATLFFILTLNNFQVRRDERNNVTTANNSTSTNTPSISEIMANNLTDVKSTIEVLDCLLQDFLFSDDANGQSWRTEVYCRVIELKGLLN